MKLVPNRQYADASPAQQQDAAAQLMALLAQFGTLRSCAPQDAAVQEKVAALQAFITEHFYTCTDEILAGLGQMYAADERFRTNIDAAGGEGTARETRHRLELAGLLSEGPGQIQILSSANDPQMISRSWELFRG